MLNMIGDSDNLKSKPCIPVEASQHGQQNKPVSSKAINSASNCKPSRNSHDKLFSQKKTIISSLSIYGMMFFTVVFVMLFLPLVVKSAQTNSNEHKADKEYHSSWSNDYRHAGQPSASPYIEPPFFDDSTSTNVTVTASKIAVLSCIVHNLGNSSVSWIRHRDLQIMSVGKATFSNDDRFQVIPKETIDDWALRIQYTDTKDSGQYDCQISTRPPISRTIHLNVIEPRARILRAPEMHVSAGSLINLTCIIPYSPEAPGYLYWYHKERMVREDGSRVIIANQLGIRSISQLVVKDANSQDSGIYTCSPAHSREQSITVHVVTDGYPAAMQGGSSVTSVGHKKLLWAMTTPLFLALVMSCNPYFYM